MKKIFSKIISLFSLAFFFVASKALAQSIIIDFGGGSSSSGGSGWSSGNYSSTGLPSGTLAGIIENIAFWLLAIFGFIGVIGFVIAGIFYLTAAGDAKQEEKAKLAMKMAIIGILVGLVGLVVIKAADALLRGSSSTF